MSITGAGSSWQSFRDLQCPVARFALVQTSQLYQEERNISFQASRSGSFGMGLSCQSLTRPPSGRLQKLAQTTADQRWKPKQICSSRSDSTGGEPGFASDVPPSSLAANTNLHSSQILPEATTDWSAEASEMGKHTVPRSQRFQEFEPEMVKLRHTQTACLFLFHTPATCAN